jgi:hypothetical protein
MKRLPIAIIMGVVLSLVIAAALVGCEANTQASGSDNPNANNKPESSKEDATVQSAMSAAPMTIAKDAAIVDYPTQAGEPFIEVRKGTNDWTCFPDWQATPGNDPQCLDETWMQWNDAFMGGTKPKITAPGR